MAHSHAQELFAVIAMSDFVNYHKRSVTLPPGCKDLTDLFDLATPSPSLSPMDVSPPPSTLYRKAKKSLSEMKQQALSAFHSHTQPQTLPFEMAWNETGTTTLDGIESLVARVYESQMPVTSLTLHTPDLKGVHWSFMRMREPIEASHCVLNIPYASTEQVAAADRIFAAHGLKPRRLENFHLCKPDAFPDIAYTIESMPPDAAACAKLVQDLFQELIPGGITAPLKFTYGELRQKP